MLATLTDRYFSDPAWIFERKLDGERCLAFRRGGEVRLLSRSQQHLNHTYPEVVDGLARQDAPTLSWTGRWWRLRGAGPASSGCNSVWASPAKLRRGEARWLCSITSSTSSTSTVTTPPRWRSGTAKCCCGRCCGYRDALRYTSHRNAVGEEYFEFACAHGWEGLVAKRADSTYSSRRSPDWLKFKCSSGQEFVIGGFTDPAGSRVGLGALLVGYYDGGELVYAGKVGTGFSTATLLALRQQLDALGTGTTPFARGRVVERGVHWARPELVAEVVFSEWTSDGKLRHPRFEGLRTDKAAREVQRERPERP